MLRCFTDSLLFVPFAPGLYRSWQSYVVKRQTICYRDKSLEKVDLNSEEHQRALENVERKWLFHGTTVEVVDKILQQGFNRSFCGRNATLYGRGVYFARDACYSADPKYAVSDNFGN